MSGEYGQGKGRAGAETVPDDDDRAVLILEKPDQRGSVLQLARFAT